MRKFTIAGIAALAIAGSTAVYAQHQPWFHEHMQHMRMTPEDRAAFVDARIAAVHAGLKLTPDQEKLWPPVESRGAGFRQAPDRSRQCADEGAARPAAGATSKADDPVTRLRERADNMAARAAAMKKIADAADPLYKTLDDGQKRRLAHPDPSRRPVRRRAAGGTAGWSAAWTASTGRTGTATAGPERL